MNSPDPTLALAAELREALAHLDDPPYLERLALARCLRACEQDPSLSAGQGLRRALRLAIASLDPGIEATSSPLKARTYQVLYRHAIARQSMISIGMSLGISARQAYRELNAAIEGLEHIVMPQLRELPKAVGPQLDEHDDAALREQFAWLAHEPVEDVDLSDLVQQVLVPIREMATQRGVELAPLCVAPGLHARGKRLVLRQVTLNLLSHAISVSSLSPVALTLEPDDPDIRLVLRYAARQETSTLAANSPYAMALSMLQFSAIRWQRLHGADGTVELRLAIPGPRRARVLIIDDNAGLINLYSRFLARQPYEVLGATDLDRALQSVAEAPPDVILLDIMMPGHDGWEVLQALRRTQGGQQARVIVCSVINDPGLASALGTQGFLNKPLDQTTLIQTLSGVLTSPK